MNLYVFLLSLLLINVKCDSPNYPLNGNYNQTYLDSLDSNVFILEALNFIFTGSYNGTSQISDDLDENPLSNLLDGGLLILADILLENDPNNKDIIIDIQKILNKLRENGTNAVLFKEIKDYLTINNALAGVAFYFQLNKASIYERFQQYLSTQFLEGLSPVCKAHSLLWFNDIANFEMWAIQMLDSTAKIPPGLLNANINWVGNYKECTGVFHDFNMTDKQIPPIEGKYCRAGIGFPISELANDLPVPPNFGLQIGMCYSKACTNGDVEIIVSNSLKLVGAFKQSKVNEAKCDDTQEVKYTPSTIAWIVLLSLIMTWVGVSAFYDIALRIEEFINKPDEDIHSKTELRSSIGGDDFKQAPKVPSKIRLSDGAHKFLINSSFYSNAEKVLNTEPKSAGLISCLSGLRVFSTIWIIWGHTYNYATDRRYFLLLDNVRDLLDLSQEAYAQLIINGMFAVDTFFLMSGLVLTVSFFKKLEKSGRLSAKEWAYYYIHRYWRLMPPYLIIIIISTQIMPYFGNGPFFVSSEYPPYNEECYTYWYSYILLLNNFIADGKGSHCMGYLWYIPNDFQFYALSPLFLILLYKVPKAGKIFLSFCLGATLFILALLASNVYVSRKKDIIMVLLDMWDDVYIKPYNRAAPYLVGLYLGYIIYKYKRIKVKYIYVALGWLASTGLALVSLFGGYTNHKKDGRQMETAEYAIYFSVSRLTWALSISWVIFACHYGYGGIVNKFLSCRPVLALSRLCYAAYLIHPPIMQFYFYTRRSIFHGDFVSLVYLPLGHICMAFFLSFFYALFFEIPFIAFEKLVF